MSTKIKHEEIEQKALIARANYHPICRDYLFANPNGGSRHKLEAYNLQLQGVKAGIPDLCLAYPTQMYPGLYIELKRREKAKARISDEQQTWIYRLRKVGYCAVVCYGWESAWDTIIRYLNNETIEQGAV